ncbi:MAG TPA: decarboxylating 6-phosphogluconate dehydrogenase [Marmoricola sp.]|nr:decarboxylating 6-phosphogluconate dehydrogenase [Marmoricola sp.]
MRTCGRSTCKRANLEEAARMDIGLVGLGKMGGNMRTRLKKDGHTVVGYDRNPDVSDVGSLQEMVEQLPAPKVVWVMVPAGEATRSTIRELADLLGEGDLVVDGGNSKWTDDAENAAMLAEHKVGFVDCGVSGGVWGLDNGYALMCGGPAEEVAKVQPALDSLKPDGERGFVHAGRMAGAGHFAKMVHNGIEYAMMQAYAEGWELLQSVELVENVTEVFNSWREGTVIRSWLLDLLVAALEDDSKLSQIQGYAADSGEGRWTVQAAIDHGVAMPAISSALFARFVSQQDDSPAMKAIAAMRNQFGGHAMQTAPPVGGDVAKEPDVQPSQTGAPTQSAESQKAGAGHPDTGSQTDSES